MIVLRALAPHLVAVVVAAALLCIPSSLSAQSAQPWSIQPSFLAASQDLNDSFVSGFGFEGQIRYTPASLWSIGLGLRLSSHSSGDESIDITGVFAEPRYTIDIGSDRVAPYLAGRFAFLRQSGTFNRPGGGTLDVSSNGFGIGAGAGLLIRLTGRVNLDGGAAFVNQGFSSAEVDGATVEFDRFFGYVAKVGLSVGFGQR